MIHNHRVTAFVPIKEHSERVPEKNFRTFVGKPLYHHILEILDRTFAVDEIVVDTDSARVMLEAPKVSHKVRVVERPASLCGDMVSVNKILKHNLESAEGDIFIQTHATNPLLKPQTIADALRRFIKLNATKDSLFTVTEHHSRFYDAEARAINHDPTTLIRTQDLAPVYEENSCLYVFTQESFAKADRRIGAEPSLFPISPIEAMDIDDEFTFRLAELLAMYGQGNA